MFHHTRDPSHPAVVMFEIKPGHTADIEAIYCDLFLSMNLRSWTFLGVCVCVLKCSKGQEGRGGGGPTAPQDFQERAFHI